MGIRQHETLMVLISYDTLYEDGNVINPCDLIKGIPSVPALELIVTYQNRSIYAYSDAGTQLQMIREMAAMFNAEEQSKIQRFIDSAHKTNDYPTLMDNGSSFLFYLLVLQNYCEGIGPLTNEERKRVFQAYLYCSYSWLKQQQSNLEGLDFLDLSFRVDIPVVEFKTYKDFKVQLYKACRFFKFCQENEEFKPYATAFFEDKGVENAGEYLLRLLSLFLLTAKEPSPVYIAFRQDQEQELLFFEQFVAQPEDCAAVWDNKDMMYLRDHFLIKVQDDTKQEVKFLLLNSILLQDKIYQGMTFDFAGSVLKRKDTTLLQAQKYFNKGSFTGHLAQVFSESQLLYDTMALAFPDARFKKFEGEYLHKQKVEAEPDYCMQDGDKLFLIEFKDGNFAETAKQSIHVEDMKAEIVKKICKFGGSERKGAGQLVFTIDSIFNKKSMLFLGVDPSKIKEVFPIVVPTDRTYRATGVNAFVNMEFSRFLGEAKMNVPAMIWNPVVIDFETLFNLIVPLREKKYDLGDLLRSYIFWRTKPPKHMNSFSGFVQEVLPLQQLKQEDIPLLFSGLQDLVQNEDII